MTLFPVFVSVYHKEQLVTKEEAQDVLSKVWEWRKVAVTKDHVIATRIADILDKYGFDDVALHIRGNSLFVCVCLRAVCACMHFVGVVMLLQLQATYIFQ